MSRCVNRNPCRIVERKPFTIDSFEYRRAVSGLERCIFTKIMSNMRRKCHFSLYVISSFLAPIQLKHQDPGLNKSEFQTYQSQE